MVSETYQRERNTEKPSVRRMVICINIAVNVTKLCDFWLPHLYMSVHPFCNQVQLLVGLLVLISYPEYYTDSIVNLILSFNLQLHQTIQLSWRLLILLILRYCMLCNEGHQAIQLSWRLLILLILRYCMLCNEGHQCSIDYRNR